MDSLKKIVDDVSGTFCCCLIVGNHDTITLFGINEQNDLSNYTRKITNSLLQEHKELDIFIMKILAEIKKFDNTSNRKYLNCIPTSFSYKLIKQEYIKIVSYLDNITQFLKMQQIQLIKENKMLEKWEEALMRITAKLEICIEEGSAKLQERPKEVNNHLDSVIPPLLNSDSGNWYRRLEKRINELIISHTISLQSQAQIKLMYSNNLDMSDKITDILSTTIPVWRNQMAIALGIELCEKRIKNQKEILDSTKQFILCTKRPQRTDIVDSQVKMLNQKLTIAINDVIELQANRDGLRNELLTIKNKAED